MMTDQRRSLSAAIVFLLSGGLAGIVPRADRVSYETFGMTEGIFGLFLVYVLLERKAWSRASGLAGWLAVGYGFWATAQLLELLFPPPGLLEWIVVSALALTAWAALGAGTRHRLVGSLATLALLLSLLKYSVIPILYSRAGPQAGEAFGFGDLAEGLRQLVVAYEPVRPAAELLGVLAIGLWVIGTRLIWPPTAD